MSGKAVVLLSGGLDSATALMWALRRKMYDEVHTLSFDYGQRHNVELTQVFNLVNELGIENHFILPIAPGDIWGPSPLTDAKAVDKDGFPEHELKEMGDTVASTYVPGRNLIFLSYAFGYALSRNIEDIVLGVNQVDYSGYPDCRGEFLDDFDALAANLARGTRQYVVTEAPLLNLSKVDIVKMGAELGVPFQYTWSCYNPKRVVPAHGPYDDVKRWHLGHPDGGIYAACGKCDSCKIRRDAFQKAGIKDPCPYVI